MGDYVENYKTHLIDLKLPESIRWNEVIRKEKKNVKKFLKLNHSIIYRLIGSKFGEKYKKYEGLYIDEMESWAEGIEYTFGLISALNCQYSLYSWGVALMNKPRHKVLKILKDLMSQIPGCTTGIKWHKKMGMVHIRNMDWSLYGLGNATRLFKFKNGKREFYSVGVLGQIGVFSGMLPKKYAITINWAPISDFPDFNGYEPSMLLRWIFENCNTYEEALKELKRTPLATNVFFAISGTKDDDAAIVERTKNHSITRKIKNNCLVQSNHYVSNKFAELNSYYESLFSGLENSDSYARKVALERRITSLKADFSASTIANCLDDEDVWDENSTYQQMLFIPKTGDIKVWRWQDRAWE